MTIKPLFFCIMNQNFDATLTKHILITNITNIFIKLIHFKNKSSDYFLYWRLLVLKKNVL